MSKNKDENSKQTKLSNFFGALNKNNKSIPVNQSNQEDSRKLHNNIFKGDTVEISSDDDKTPKKNHILKNNDIKENLVDLSNEMGENKSSKFSFKTKFSLSKSSTSTQSSNGASASPKSNITVKPIHNTKAKFEYVDSDDEDEILPLPKADPKEIKPQPLFKISSKATKPAIESPLLSMKPKFTSTQFVEKTLQEERDKNVYIPKPPNIFKPEATPIIKNQSSPSNEISPIKSTPSTTGFKFRKSTSNSQETKLESPKKSSESLKILDQLSSAISSIKNSPSPIINIKSLGSTDSNASTPDIKVNNPQKSINDSCITTRLNVKMEAEEVISEVDHANTSLNEFDYQKLKDEKLKFLEYYYNQQNLAPLSLFDAVDGYNKTVTIKLKGIIQSMDRRQRNFENEMNKSLNISPCPSIPIKPAAPVNAPTISHTKKTNKIIYSSDEEDQFDIDQIMSEIEDEKRRTDGKFDNSYVDINGSSKTSTTAKFEPRINMKDGLSVREPLSSVNNEDLDEDGFPIVDYSQLEDVLPSQPSTSRQSSVNNKKIDTVDSMIPENIMDEIKISNNATGIGKFHTNVKNDGITGEFDGENYHFSHELRSAFRSTFGLKQFRQNQLQAINATLLGKDCFILMPTGGGKSLCYQLPAIMSKGVTIVISPLKSLILDQVNKLKSLDIKAAGMSGDISQTEVKAIYSDLNRMEPTIKLLYVTPEKISASSFFQDTLTSLYNNGNLARIVIDEAHCVSTWGHDFRPDYKRLGELKRRFSNVPVMALTATANERVRADVVHQLGIFGCKWFLSSFNRPNLKYIVSPKSGIKTLTDIITLIKTKFPRSSGIIYCLSRKETEQVAQKLQLANIPACSYHAGMTDKSREKAQEDWITDKCRVVCATIAFGMGIDKPDVRFVIHFAMPKSIEGYYQESGRAGRDGNLSTCILYYSYSDKMRYVNMMSNEPLAVRQVSLNNLDLVVSFCENMLDCRRTLQLNYFGEHFTREQCLENKQSSCDNCSRVMQYKNIDATETSKNLVSGVAEMCSRNGLTILQLVDIFKGAMTKKVTDAGHNKTRFHGCLKDWDRNDIQRILHKLVIEGYLREEVTVIRDIPISYVKVGPNVALLMKQGKKVEFSMLEKARFGSGLSKKTDVAVSNNQLHDTKIDELRDRLYHDLMEIARLIAEERGSTIQQVINMEALRQMSLVMPETEEEMLQIPHITKANYMKYGKRFLDAIIPYSAQRTVYEIERAEAAAAAASAASNDVDSYDEDFSSQDWDAIGRDASTSSGKQGFKRRSNSAWGRNIAKRYKRTAKKGKSPAKRKTTGTAAAKKKTQKAMMPAPRPTF